MTATQKRWMKIVLLLAPVLAFGLVLRERASWRPRTLATYEKAVTSVAFSPDGSLLAIASKQVQLWNIETRWLERTLMHKDGTVNSVAFSPNGRILASATATQYKDGFAQNGDVRLWDTFTGQLRRTSNQGKEACAVTFSPDGKIIASANGINSTKNDYTAGEVKLWDTHKGRLKRTLKSTETRMVAVAFSPDGNMIAGGEDWANIHLWDARTGFLRRTLQTTLNDEDRN